MAGLRIGWVGTGVMGRSMAEHLIRAGYSLSVYNRTPAKADSLTSQGAKFASIKEIAETCQVVFTMVGYPRDVEEVILSQGGLLESLQPGSLLVDHTSSSPGLAIRIAEAARAKNIEVVDAPVSGGDVGAREGKLAIMCGGSADGFSRAREIMKTYGANIEHMGAPGAGQHTKLTNQIILTGNMIGMVEGLVYAYKAGLDLNQMITLISAGAAGSASLRVLGPRIVRGDLEPGFYIEHFVKDLGMALEESKRLELCLPGLSMVNQFYLSLVANGESRKGTQALIHVLERLNNIQVSPRS
ncbi:unnamed protein product [Blepharisma stoltei]|uniref:6-phosphogluconate dehydrogenase n=1 Tax=Blepharisma stoltei TaxID=1481888 RepID=A0AAU9JJJ0_9CILI|nr:unnamed protein product [Blepharisma stoltei]